LPEYPAWLTFCYGEIAQELTVISSHLRKSVEAAQTPAKAAFCLRLSSAIEGEERTTVEHLTLLLVALRSFWADFALNNTKALASVPSASYTPTDDAKFITTAHDLTYILSISESHLDELGLSKQDLYSKIKSVAVHAKAGELDAPLMPLAELIVLKQVPFALQEDSLAPEAADLVSTIIYRYIVSYVGVQPVAPRDWSHRESQSSCSCRDCSAVNAFIASPTEKIGEFPVNKQRRHHLHKNFTDRASYSSYVVETLRHSNPHTWQITKNQNGFYSQEKAWKNRTDEARRRLQRIDGSEKRLSPILGNTYPGVIEAQVSAVPRDSQRIVEPLRVRDTNLKRTPPDESADGPNKRAATSQSRVNAAFIDLTED
jgi:hypothetical protein